LKLIDCGCALFGELSGRGVEELLTLHGNGLSDLPDGGVALHGESIGRLADRRTALLGGLLRQLDHRPLPLLRDELGESRDGISYDFNGIG
jgi:hypothetical protein